MRRSSLPGFPALVPLAALACAALAAPAGASCSVQAYGAGICAYPTPEPAAGLPAPYPSAAPGWTYRPPPPLVTEPPVDAAAAERRARAEIDAHFDAELAAEAARHWWKP